MIHYFWSIVKVRLTLNDEYSTIISAETTWPELVYRITKCDLTLLGFQMIQSYLSLLPGMAVSELNSEYKSSSRYTPYYNEDPDEIINRPDAIKINNSKYKSNEEKKKSFFSD